MRIPQFGNQFSELRELGFELVFGGPDGAVPRAVLLRFVLQLDDLFAEREIFGEEARDFGFEAADAEGLRRVYPAL